MRNVFGQRPTPIILMRHPVTEPALEGFETQWSRTQHALPIVPSAPSR
jgi:hypothetical protein